jgi:hypothetical protein
MLLAFQFGPLGMVLVVGVLGWLLSPAQNPPAHYRQDCHHGHTPETHDHQSRIKLMPTFTVVAAPLPLALTSGGVVGKQGRCQHKYHN